MDKILGIFKNLPDVYKKVGIPVVITVIVILGYLVYYQDQRVKQYSRELELLDERIAEKKAEIDKKVGILEGQQKSLEHKFGDLTIIISDQIFSDQIGKDFFKFIDDPNGRRLYREQQKIVINEIYEDFFADIALNEQETEELKGLLIDKQMVNLEIIVSLLKGNMTEEQIAQNEKKFAEMIVRADSNLRDFFEDDEFGLFQEYNLSLQYRNWILEFKSYLAEKEIFLDEVQEEDLLDLIFNETENFKYTEQLRVSEFNSSNLSDADRARIDRYL
ncbi:MAG: hypothetical protein GWO07_04500, partial [Candidatus Dadabacteria bacterium]|nr:hypothetical protein [Candidatus Dadabacteria bacterium]NIV40846.1 hypothetical protein [Candidatus Dadabacteria bacterium]NIX15055.1 hypothetical protein [Candidatus Dadabacteria bacterium]